MTSNLRRSTDKYGPARAQKNGRPRVGLEKSVRARVLVRALTRGPFTALGVKRVPFHEHSELSMRSRYDDCIPRWGALRSLCRPPAAATRLAITPPHRRGPTGTWVVARRCIRVLRLLGWLSGHPPTVPGSRTAAGGPLCRKSEAEVCAAVDVQDLTGHVTGVGRRKEPHHRDDVGRHTDALVPRRRTSPLDARLVQGAAEELGLQDESWGDDVRRDATGAEFGGEPCGVRLDGRLRGTVRRD